MLHWLGDNIGTILTAAVLLVLVGGVLIKLIRDKKHGKSTCGCSCGCCPMSGACHKQK